MTIELTEKFIAFFDIMAFKSLMARADASDGMSHSELFDILDRAEMSVLLPAADMRVNGSFAPKAVS